MQITGAEVMVKCLEEEGVSTIFGYPGGAILPFYDALRGAGIKHILTAHEQGLCMRQTALRVPVVRLVFAVLHPAPVPPI